MTPRFIVLEALDGVGKTTLCEGLAAALVGLPMNTPGRALRTLSPAVLDALGTDQAARCLFYASSVIAQGGRARHHVEEGKPVVMDRYWLSTVAYAHARGVHAPLEQVRALVEPPDLTVLLTLDETVRQQRLGGRGLTAADRETLDPRFTDTVMAQMQRPRGGFEPDLVFDMTGLGPEEAVQRLLRELKHHIEYR